MADKQSPTSSSQSVRMGSSTSTHGATLIGPNPEPLRRGSSAMLSRRATFPDTGRRLEHFYRRQLRLRRPRPVHPAAGVPGAAGALGHGAASLPKRGEIIDCSEESVTNKLEPQERNGRRFPDFDGLKTYNVDDNITKELRQAEATRLLKVAKDPTQPILLGRNQYLESMKGDKDGYQALSRMSTAISTALNLCLLDNECISVEFCGRLASRDRLRKLIRQAHIAADMSTSENDPGAPKCDPADEEERLMATFALTDYISAIIARLISQTASGDFWITNLISVLSARVAKIKFLLVDLTTGAAIAASAGEDTLEAFPDTGNSAPTEEEEEEECEEAQRVIDANTKEGLTSEEDAAVGTYCINQNKYRAGINAAMKYILFSLRFLNRSGLPPTTFEISIVLYEIGFENFKTVLFQDRDLEYSASSDRDVLNTAQPALFILDQTLKELYKRQPRQMQSGNEKQEADNLGTFVEWAYQERDEVHSETPAAGIDYVELPRSRRTMRLDSMAHIATAMVPLIATSPILLAGFTAFRNVMALSGTVRDVVRPFQEGQFGAFCRLYTSEFDREVEERGILRLSKAFQDQRFSRCRLLTQGDGKWGAKLFRRYTDGTRDAGNVVQERLQECCTDMKEWVVDETSVTISLRFYVSTVMMIAAILSGGGLAIGFTVGDRIQGVDPFNLATYTWVLAAFVVLICKSVLVDNWTWSDFLRRRVRCRSVSELAATTGVDEQLILAKLLHDDCGGSILLTRGPYNSVFRRQTDDTNGFSIDCPISAETLMLSGLAALKVVTPRGDAIVCLDYRQGTTLTVVEHQSAEDKGRLICEDLNPVSATSKRTRGWYGLEHSLEPVKLRLTKKDAFKWKRVQGLYDFNGAHVVFE
ncbi:hypothetical protein OQA88_5462 [Cercophora sp. LCS_1]